MTRAPAVISTLGLLAILVTPSLAAPQSSLPAIRPIGPIVARARDSIGAVAQMVQLSDGRVMINDTRKKRLFILDSSLSNPTVVADTTSGTKKAYGSSAGALFLYRGDTTLFLDFASQGFLVIDPAGKIVRVMAAPLPGDAVMIAQLGRGFDSAGRLLYRRGYGRSSGDPSTQDSDVVIRADFATRAVDTVGFVRFDKQPNMVPGFDTKGNKLQGVDVIQLWPRHDVDALLSDGTIAFIRAQDFTIDWLDPDGTRRSTPRVAHDWHRLADSEKEAITDSLRAFHQAHPNRAVVFHPDGTETPAEFVPIVPDPSTLPDYRPAFTTPVRVDLDANLWVPDAPTWILQPPPGTPAAPTVYNVINRLGVLIDRVQLPGGTSIVGFGHGVAYLSAREGATASLVRVRIR